MNFASWLTLSRIVLLPLALLPVILGWEEGWLIAAAVNAVAGSSDFADGRLARGLKMATPLGANLDFICDKIYIGGMLIALASLGLIAVWILVVVLLREAGILTLRLSSPPSRPLAADFWGRAKTFASFMAISWILLDKSLKTGSVLGRLGAGGFLAWLLSLASWTMLVAVALTVFSGFNYVRKSTGFRVHT